MTRFNCLHCSATESVELTDPVIRIVAKSKREAQMLVDIIPYKELQPCSVCGGTHKAIFYGEENEVPDGEPILISIVKS